MRGKWHGTHKQAVTERDARESLRDARRAAGRGLSDALAKTSRIFLLTEQTQWCILPCNRLSKNL